MHRLIERAAKAHGQTVEQYALEAIEVRLRHDRDAGSAANAMTAAADPVLAELWDNPRDAEHDRPRIPA